MSTTRLLTSLFSAHYQLSTKISFLFSATFWKCTFLPGALGFSSVYIVWITWAHLFNWDAWVSYAYTYGDHLILPLFNAIAFVLIVNKRGTIPPTAALILVPVGLFVAFFEPGASYFRQIAYVDWWLRGYHSGFIFLEFSFVFFVFGVYPFLGRVAYAPLHLTSVLFLLMASFLGLVFIADDHINEFPLWQKATTGGVLAANYAVLVLDRKLKFIGKLKRGFARWRKFVAQEVFSLSPPPRKSGETRPSPDQIGPPTHRG